MDRNPSDYIFYELKRVLNLSSHRIKVRLKYWCFPLISFNFSLAMEGTSPAFCLDLHA